MDGAWRHHDLARRASPLSSITTSGGGEGCREAGIDLGDLPADALTDEGERLGVGQGRLRHDIWPIESEARLVEHLFERVARMRAAQAEAPPRLVIVEEREIGEERVRPCDRRPPRCAPARR